MVIRLFGIFGCRREEGGKCVDEEGGPGGKIIWAVGSLGQAEARNGGTGLSKHMVIVREDKTGGSALTNSVNGDCPGRSTDLVGDDTSLCSTRVATWLGREHNT